LAGIAMSMRLYANENNDAFPTVVTRSLRLLGAEPGAGDTGSADAWEAAQSFYTPGDRRPAQCLWLLVVLGMAQPEQFICPGDTASAALKTVSATNQNWASDFASSKNFSYSMASPWVEGELQGRVPSLPVAPWWRNSGDANQPIMADGIRSGADFGRLNDVCSVHLAERGGLEAGARRKRGDPIDIDGPLEQGSNVAFQDAHVEWVPITQQGSNFSVQVPSGGTAPDASGIYATGAVFPSGRYVTPTTITATKVGGVYDMIFVPPLVGR
jgi:hypothetical protein